METTRSLWVYMRWHVPGDGNKKTLLRRFLNLFPVRFSHQALFAEAFSQALVSGMEVHAAIDSAATTCTCRRFQYAMQKMASYCRTGDSLERGLVKSGTWISKRFRASLRVGETRGLLAEELAAFARSYSPDISERLARSLGRSPQVTQFIMALSRLLNDHRLTIGVIEDASVVAAGRGSRFDRAISAVVEEMRNGKTFSCSLESQFPVFDRFLCILVAASPGRAGLRQSLMRTCGIALDNGLPQNVPVEPATR